VWVNSTNVNIRSSFNTSGLTGEVLLTYALTS